MPAFPRRFRLLCGLLLALGGAGRAADPAPQRAAVDDQDAVVIRGVFDYQLPKILEPGALRVTVTPRWTDLLRRDVVRVRCQVRYAFNSHLEGSVEAVPYFDNFGGKGRGGGGVAEFRIGGKLAWTSLLRPYVDTALGATVVIPGPGAGPETNLGSASFSPYIVFARRWERVRGLESFLNLGVECFDSDPAPGRIASFRPQRDNLSVTPGVVLHCAPWHYAAAVSWRSTILAGDNRNYLSVLPSVSWEVPSRYTLGLGGRWVAGLGYEAVFFDDGTEHRFTGRLKWDFDWRKAARTVGNRVRDRLPWGSGHNGRDTRPTGEAH